MPMTTEEMVAAVKEARDQFAAMQLYPGRRYMVSHLRDKMGDLHTELVHRLSEEKAAQQPKEGPAA